MAGVLITMCVCRQMPFARILPLARAGGWDLDNEVAFQQEEGFAYEPDVIVIGFSVNDVLPPRRTLREAIASGELKGRSLTDLAEEATIEREAAAGAEAVPEEDE